MDQAEAIPLPTLEEMKFAVVKLKMTGLQNRMD
jgi:hypothetical protein